MRTIRAVRRLFVRAVFSSDHMGDLPRAASEQSVGWTVLWTSLIASNLPRSVRCRKLATAG